MRSSCKTLLFFGTMFMMITAICGSGGKHIYKALERMNENNMLQTMMLNNGGLSYNNGLVSSGLMGNGLLGNGLLGNGLLGNGFMGPGLMSSGLMTPGLISPGLMTPGLMGGLGTNTVQSQSNTVVSQSNVGGMGGMFSPFGVATGYPVMSSPLMRTSSYYF